jgi:beta-glucosidase
VLESVKHFAGDGGTEWDSRDDTAHADSNNWQAASENWRIDQGDTRTDEETLREIHLTPYKAAVEAGALNIMVSFSSWNGLKLHAHEYLLTQVLKQEWGFEGFLVSDWMAINQISADFYECVVRSINAGLDMIMVPYDYEKFITTLTAAVENGDVLLSRIDDAVTRILRVKFELGLFETPFTEDSLLDEIGCEAHRQIAKDAVHQSAVLLKNDQSALPLQTSQTIAVAGKAADDIGLACGGWTINWQGGSGDITEGTTLLEGIQAHAGSDVLYVPSGEITERVDTAVVVLAETPYAEGEGDRADLTLSDEDITLIESVRPMCDRLVLVLYSGRPLIIDAVVDRCDAIVAAWLPGSEAAVLADNLFGDVPFSGKLSFKWVRSMDDLPSGPQYATESDAAPQWERGFGLTL